MTAARAMLLAGWLAAFPGSPGAPPRESGGAAGEPVERTILALYDGTGLERADLAPVLRLAEMPLNHLGLVLRPHDLRSGPPALSSLGGVLGILCWFRDDRMDRPAAFVDWLERAVAGRKLIWMGQAAFTHERSGRETPAALQARAWRLIGVENLGQWSDVTYDTRVVQADPAIVGYERKLEGVLPGYSIFRLVDNTMRRHLTVRRGKAPGVESVLAATGPRGGFIASGYTHSVGPEHYWQWYVNPFEFFRLALLPETFPAPDTATVAGRRIYYSHIDGDGWRNRTEVMPYRRDRLLASEVVLRKLIRPYPDLPVTVAPIAGDLDPAWYGTEETMGIARRMLAEPQVEAGTHTYTHPLKWEFFEQYDRSLEPQGPDATGEGEETHVPRAYMRRPFDLDHEIAGSMEYIEKLTPPGKKVRVVQWSGNTRAYEAAIAAARRAGVPNINGGDSRFDDEYPSVIWLAPLTRKVGAELQVYSSNSNENTYTDLWTNRFFGYRLVQETIRRTGAPVRLRPFNLYYHMYTGEKHAALYALVDSLEMARRSELAPIETSRFTRIVEGFCSARLTRLGPARWRVEDRGALETVRFDRAADRSVDFGRSSGVVGERVWGGSLYVTLDAADPAPVVALRPGPPSGEAAALVHSRWRVWKVRREPDSVRFQAHGYGRGDMQWRVPFPGDVTVKVNGTPATHGRTAAGGLLDLKLDADAIGEVSVEIRAVGGAL
ncbi:MAG: hypothetical protein R2729_02730 [Bryobacteraceae bacterium]